MNDDNTWKSLLSESISLPDDLPEQIVSDRHAIDRVIRTYPMRVNPYYLSLIGDVDDPIWKQAIPSLQELEGGMWQPDPLDEESQSPVPCIIHRYPNRVVFLVSNRCAVYCRHCMRKRRVGKRESPGVQALNKGVAYIRSHTGISDVILSGGDPLLLDDSTLDGLLYRLAGIPHVRLIRIHSRVPCTLPQRITGKLLRVLKKFQPLYLNTQFNHPDEITNVSTGACRLLADAGIVLGCQTVLLKGVNDSPATMKKLMEKLVDIRIRPYYLHHPDLVQGTHHFQPDIAKGLSIMSSLRGHCSGLAVPQYMIDLPGGGGKIPLLPEYIVEKKSTFWRIRNHQGGIYEYPTH
ncbi:MAG: KamA family radical SAM protein [Desulfobacteraceae bacterium]|nr:KamA family radical SAM protein [Desulfobacteraceae bacterium]